MLAGLVAPVSGVAALFGLRCLPRLVQTGAEEQEEQKSRRAEGQTGRRANGQTGAVDTVDDPMERLPVPHESRQSPV